MRLPSIPLWGWLCLLFSAGAAHAQIPANSFAASTNHSASIKPDGSLWTWGINFEGQLGNGTTAATAEPTRVLADDPNTTWAQVATGTSHTLALTTDGRLYAWGRNAEGQLGDNTTAQRTAPTAVKLPAEAGQLQWKQIATGTSHSLALTTDGRLYTWGYNHNGQLGTGYARNRTAPVEIPLPPAAANTTWAQVTAGNNHTLALTADGRLFAWGGNAYGQLGFGSTAPSLLPVAVGISKKTAKLRWAHVAAGRFHSVAVTTDGRLYAWGSNRFGQLADADDFQHSTPTAVSLPARWARVVWKQAAAGDAHSLALSADGRLIAWGNNCAGQLGDGGTARQLQPVAVALPLNTTGAMWTQVASGSFHTMAYTSDGRLGAWGCNAFGQLGDGTTTHRSRPVLQDPALTARTYPAEKNISNAGSSGAGAAEAWGLNDTRLINEIPAAPSFMMLPNPKNEPQP